MYDMARPNVARKELESQRKRFYGGLECEIIDQIGREGLLERLIN